MTTRSNPAYQFVVRTQGVDARLKLIPKQFCGVAGSHQKLANGCRYQGFRRHMTLG
jgi:hypothetical protein